MLYLQYPPPEPMLWHDDCPAASWPHGHVIGPSQRENTLARDPAARWGRGHFCIGCPEHEKEFREFLDKNREALLYLAQH